MIARASALRECLVQIRYVAAAKRPGKGEPRSAHRLLPAKQRDNGSARCWPLRKWIQPPLNIQVEATWERDGLVGEAKNRSESPQAIGRG
jgi:hypothetical protein